MARLQAAAEVLAELPVGLVLEPGSAPSLAGRDSRVSLITLCHRYSAIA